MTPWEIVGIVLGPPLVVLVLCFAFVKFHDARDTFERIMLEELPPRVDSSPKQDAAEEGAVD